MWILYTAYNIIIFNCKYIDIQNRVKHLKEDVLKKELTICKAEERERRLNVKCENASHDLKQERDEVRFAQNILIQIDLNNLQKLKSNV